MFALSDLSWHLGILISFVGWGLLLARVVAKDEAVGLGLKVGWGVAVFLGVGGVLLAVHVAYRGVVIAVLIVGQLAVVYDLVRRRREYLTGALSALRLARERPVMALMVALVAVIVLGRMTTAPFILSATFRTDDDAVAYLYYPKQMVEMGASVEPFSHRHATALNGQSFLQAAAVTVLPIQRAFGVDSGLFVAVAVLVLSSISNRRWLERSPLELLPELGLALLPSNGLYENTRLGAPLNLTSHFTGIALLLTVYASLRRAETLPIGWRPLLTVALPTAATFTLRPMYAPMLAILLAASYALPLLRLRSGEPYRRRAAAFFGIGVFTIALLIPWCVAAYRSDGTPLFPLFQGYVTAVPRRVHEWRYDAQQAVWALNNDLWVRTALILALAGLCIRARQHAALRTALIVGALGSVVVLVRMLPGDWNPHTTRYLAPVFAAMAFALAAEAMALLSKDAPITGERLAPPVVAAFGLLLNLHETRDVIGQIVTEGANALHDAHDKTAAFMDRRAKYDRMQAMTVPGAGILVAAVDGYLFDSARNPIYTVDHVALEAPPPGFPSNQPADVAAAYFLQHGVRYVAVGSEKADPIDLRVWGVRFGKGDSSNATLWPQADWADAIVPGIKELDTLTAGAKPVFSDSDYVIVDLNALR